MPPPLSVPGYTILDTIALGGMAELLLAERIGSHGSRRRVVLKRILPQLAADPEFRARFVHEARIAMRLAHANIVQVFDFIDQIGQANQLGQPGACLLVMELVDGCDLRALLSKEGRLPLDVALYVCRDLLFGLDHAHRCITEDGAPLEIVHRDVSPGNILLSREGEVKLSDFGLCGSRERAGQSVGGVKGTFAFMAPEQAAGCAVDARADVFAAGTILYTMLAGESPWEGGGPAATLDRVRAARYVPLAPRLDLPRDLDVILERALRPRPEERFASAGEMATAIDALARRGDLRLDRMRLKELLARTLAPPAPMPPTPVVAPAADAAEPSPSREGSVAAPFRKTQPASVIGPGRRRLGPRVTLGVAGGMLVVAAAWLAISFIVGHRPSVAQRPVTAEPRLPVPPPPAGPRTESGTEHDTEPRSEKVRSLPHDPPRPARPAAARALPGRLSVSVDPWAYVVIDGKRRGTTPLRRLELSPGAHEVILDNPELGATVSRIVHIESNRHQAMIERLAGHGRP